MATKPLLVQEGKTVDCTGLLVRDNTVLEGRELPSFIVLQTSLFDETIYQNIVISDNTKLTNFLNKQPLLINSYTLGKTLQDDKLIELSCGIIQINYHWFNQTNIAISYVKDTKSINGINLPIVDSVFVNNNIYRIDRSKSTSFKLVTIEPISETGMGLLVKGQFDSYYFINDCQITRGFIRSISELSVLDCEKDDCNPSSDLDKYYRDLMILKSAYIKLQCGDPINANQLIKKLCKDYASKCATQNSVISDCEKDYSEYVSDCLTCN